MDSIWTHALAVLAVIAAALSYKVPRAWVWIACMTTSFLVSTLYLDYGSDPLLHPWLTFACDSLVFLAVLRWHRESWEIGVLIAFFASVMASLLRIWGIVQIPWVYASMLELANAAALLCIAGTGMVELIGRRPNSTFHTARSVIRSPRDSA